MTNTPGGGFIFTHRYSTPDNEVLLGGITAAAFALSEGAGQDVAAFALTNGVAVIPAVLGSLAVTEASTADAAAFAIGIASRIGSLAATETGADTASMSISVSGGTTASAAFPGVPWQVVGYDVAVGNRIADGSLINVSTGTLPAGMTRSTNIATITAPGVYSGLKFPAGWECAVDAPDGTNVTLRDCTFTDREVWFDTKCNLTVSYCTFDAQLGDGGRGQYNRIHGFPGGGSNSIDHCKFLHSPADILKGDRVIYFGYNYVDFVGWAPGAHGDVIQEALLTSGTMTIEYNFVNGVNPTLGAITSFFRAGDSNPDWVSHIDVQHNVGICANINFFAPNSMGSAGSFTAKNNYIAMVGDPGFSNQVPSSFLYSPDGYRTSGKSYFVYDNHKLVASGSSSGFSADGTLFTGDNFVINQNGDGASTGGTAGSSTPSAFSFTNVTNATKSTSYSSNTITIAGLGTGVSVGVTVTGAGYSKNGAASTSAPGTAVNGDTFQIVGLVSSGNDATAVSATLTVGDVSANYTVTTAAAAGSAWTPASLGAKLVAWYDGTDAASMTTSTSLISQWNDKSGNARHLTASGSERPTLTAAAVNGKSAVTWSGAGTRMAATWSYTGSTVGGAVSLKMTASSDADARVISLTTGTSADWNSAGRTALIDRQGSSSDLFSERNGSMATVHATYDTWGVVGSVYDGTNHTMWLNDTASTTTASTGAFAIGKIVVGNGADSLTAALDGQTQHVVLTTGNLTTLERQKLYAFLAWEAGTNALLDGTNPYTTSPP